MTSKSHRFLVLAMACVIALAGLSGGASRSHIQREQPAASQTSSEHTGYSTTLLPDGTYLLTGGTSDGLPTVTIAIQHPGQASPRRIHETLSVPRVGHTATLLPDGHILIRGGKGTDGLIVRDVEIVDLGARRVGIVDHPVPFHRSGHTSTVLSDGRVLTLGGRGEDGRLLNDGEIWDPTTGESTLVAGFMQSGRAGHSATLEADGRVRVSGGVDDGSAASQADELFDPSLGAFSTAPAGIAVAPTPSIVSSSPADESVDVPTDTTIALRFSTQMAVTSLNTRTVALLGEGATAAVTVVPTEQGRLVFVRPRSPLGEGMEYVLSLDGVRSVDERSLPATALRFTTAKATDLSSATDEESWIPNTASLRDWRSGRPESPWRQLSALQATPGVTALAGQVLLLNGKPLADVTLSIGSRSTRSDRTGRFLLTNLPAGGHVLRIDGGSASRPRRTFGVFDVGVYVHRSRTNVLSYSIWMPVLDTRNAVTIPSPTTSEVVVTTPHIPGLELRIPPGTVIRDAAGQVVRSVSITAIPVDRPPFPLPTATEVPVYFTIQPGSATLSSDATPWPAGARLVYPNYRSQPAGKRIDFWQYDAEDRGWFVYGQGTVTPDQRQVVPDERVSLYRFTGAMVSDPTIVPPAGPEPGDDDHDGDPVDLSTGQFVLRQTDLLIPDVLPITVNRTYRPQDTVSRAFGTGGTIDHDMFIVGDTWPYTYLLLVLPDGGQVRFERTSPGTSFYDAVYEHLSTPSRFHRAVVRWIGSGSGDARAWALTLKDGTTYIFPEAEGNANPYLAALTAVVDRNGNELTVMRNDEGEITALLSPNGRLVSLTYDTGHRITRAEDTSGRTVTYTYDASGRLWKVTNPAGGVTEYTYDSGGRLATIEDAREVVYLTNEYDADGRVARQTLANGGEYEFVYTANGQGRVVQTEVTDPRGFVRRVTFNSSGYTLTDTRALGTPEAQTTTYVRHGTSHRPLSITDALNRRTTFGYDGSGNVTSVTRLADTQDAVTTTFAYNAPYQQLSSITDPLNHTATFTYDTHGNLIEVVDANGHSLSRTHDAQGRVQSINDGVGNVTQFIYSGPEVAQVINPLNHSSHIEFDEVGRLARLTTPRGHRTEYEYNAVDQVTRITDALGNATALTYDANNNLLSLSDALSQGTSHTYDGMDRVLTRADALDRVQQYAYDLAGNMRQTTDRNSQVTSISYDPINRPFVVTYADTSTVTYTYDLGNRLVNIDDSATGTITRTYDGLDRLLSETTPQGTVGYTYDAAGRRATMSALGQPLTVYTYDSGNRLTSIVRGAQTVAFGYDAANRRTTLWLPNSVTVSYAYDAASHLTSLIYTANGSTLGDLQYTYDADGNVTTVGGSWARTGLPPSLASATYDAANQLATWDGVTLLYDGNGNLTSDGSKSYTWNARNQLTALSGGVNTSFVYDPIGRRRSKTIGATTTNLLYDGPNHLQEQTTDGIPTADLLTGVNIDETFTRGVNALLSDRLGSTLAESVAMGSVTTEYTYEPFGRTATTGLPSDNPQQFTGRENDGTGLYFYRARYYSPTLHRFISPDPLGFADGINVYSYVGCSPTNYMDPLGMEKEKDCFAQLKFRMVASAQLIGGSHSYWYAQDGNGGQYIIGAGPRTRPGGGGSDLWVWPPSADLYGGPDNISGETWWDSGMSPLNCEGVDALLDAARRWPNGLIPYYPWGPNSNSAARDIGARGGFRPPMPPGGYGWGTPPIPR